MGNHFFAYLYRLRYIERWSLMRNIRKENVAEHSFYVAALAQVLCTIANEIFHKQVPTEKVVSLALLHDCQEIFVGDIPTPVKHANPKILQNFREIENLASERLLNMVPTELLSFYKPLIQNQDKELIRWVKAADLLDAYLKCITELSAGNQEFSIAKKQIEKNIQALDMQEVHYFLEHMAPSFEKTLDELSE